MYAAMMTSQARRVGACSRKEKSLKPYPLGFPTEGVPRSPINPLLRGEGEFAENPLAYSSPHGDLAYSADPVGLF